MKEHACMKNLKCHVPREQGRANRERGEPKNKKSSQMVYVHSLTTLRGASGTGQVVDAL
jgi:hypothetical protein